MQAWSGVSVENKIYNEIGKCGERIGPHKRKEENGVGRFGAEPPRTATGCRSPTGNADAHEKQGL